MADTPAASGTDWAGVVGAVGALGIESYQLSQGQQVSTVLGPGGAAEITSGQATNQQTLFLVVLALGLLFAFYLVFVRK